MATLCRNLTRYAADRDIQFLCVRGGPVTRTSQQGSVTTIELKRSIASFPLDDGLYCDPLLSRYLQFVERRLLEFDPDVVHITGPGDLGFLGVCASFGIRVPLAASWHTNLHEYAARRLNKALWFLPFGTRASICAFAEHHCLCGLLRFYRLARFTMAPNEAACSLIAASTSRPAFLMAHGVDTRMFSPACCSKEPRPFCIGYVGRLTSEKNVRAFVGLEQELLARGHRDFKILLIGDGGEKDWLKRRLKYGECLGVLRDEALAQGFARMDVFVFPSQTDTFGLVLLEAASSGVPVVASPSAGARAGLQDGVNALLSDDLASAVSQLMTQPGVREEMGRAARRFACSHNWCHAFDSLYLTYARGLTAERYS